MYEQAPVSIISILYLESKKTKKPNELEMINLYMEKKFGPMWINK